MRRHAEIQPAFRCHVAPLLAFPLLPSARCPRVNGGIAAARDDGDCRPKCSALSIDLRRNCACPGPAVRRRMLPLRRGRDTLSPQIFAAERPSQEAAASPGDRNRGRRPPCQRCRRVAAAHRRTFVISAALELPGGGQIVIQGQLRLCRPPERARGDDHPRHFRPAQAEDRQPADGAERARRTPTRCAWSATSWSPIPSTSPAPAAATNSTMRDFASTTSGIRPIPRLVTFVKTHGKGVHRFDLDENYAYISTEMEGFVGNILVIYDIRNPSKPVEVSRWWMQGQNIAGGEPPHPKGSEHRLHHAMRCGDQMYAGCWASGVAIIDVSDIGQSPHVEPYPIRSAVAGTDSHFSQGAVSDRGRSIAVSTEEERPQRGPRCRQAARAVSHLGRHRSDQAAAALYLRGAGRRVALSRAQIPFRRPPAARAAWTRTVSSTSPGSPPGCASSTSTIRRIPGRRATSSRSPATGRRRR